MLDRSDELLHLDDPSEHMFTYCECFAQVEPGERIHRFVMLQGSPDTPLTVFFARRNQNASKLVWRRRDLDSVTASKILTALAETRVPLNSQVRSWTSMHINSSLTLNRQGVSIKLWWDTFDSALGDALTPLATAMAPLVADIKTEIEKQDMARQTSEDAV